ncbi:MAG: HDOD domain-containing protein [Pirellulales bacterium]|nr:HDOD domain-containing protein [Pirellulales bacterium]
MSRVKSDSTVLPSALDRVVRRVSGLSTLPDVAIRVIEVANNDAAGAQDLKVAMEGDVALCARVLRLVNSSAYGLRQRVSNVQAAIAYLGFRQIRNVALTACVSDLFKEDRPIGKYRRSALWRHLVAVGICARMVAMRCRLDNFEDVFLAGLMHDIGIILEDQYTHAQFEQVLASLEGADSLAAIERRELGFAHTELGAAVAEHWRFPDIVTAGIRCHHGEHRDSAEYPKAVHCVEVANILCTLKGISSVGVNLLRPTLPPANVLDLTVADLEALFIDLDEELERHAALFTL